LALFWALNSSQCTYNPLVRLHSGIMLRSTAMLTILNYTYRLRKAIFPWTQFESLLADIRLLMLVNKLKLNNNKTEALALSGSQLSPVSIGDESVALSCSILIFGCVFDSNMTFEEHIIEIAKSCFFKLRNMYYVQHCITTDAAKVIVHAMIISKFDCCNAILYGQPLTSLSYVQCSKHCSKIHHPNQEVRRYKACFKRLALAANKMPD